jgi:uncharacterized phiE125 gp8 family phage protein
MALKLKTAPAIAPLTLVEAKAHCRVDHSDDDAMISGLIDAAVSHLDGHSGVLGRCMIEQTWELYYDNFPSGPLRIPLGNLMAITTVEYVDPISAIYVTWDAANYEVDSVSVDGWVIPVDVWPTPMDTSNAIRVTFTAGYGAAAADVPAAIRAAMLLLIGHWYANREAVVIGETPTPLPMAANALITPFRRVGT